MMKKLKLFIDNEWVEPEGGKYFTSYCPATGQPLVELASASESDVDKAVKAARRAFPEWSKMDGDMRADLMVKALKIIIMVFNKYWVVNGITGNHPLF